MSSILQVETGKPSLISTAVQVPLLEQSLEQLFAVIDISSSFMHDVLVSQESPRYPSLQAPHSMFVVKVVRKREEQLRVEVELIILFKFSILFINDVGLDVGCEDGSDEGCDGCEDGWLDGIVDGCLDGCIVG